MKHLALLVFLAVLPVLAQVPGELPVAEAIVFKNGLAFVTRQGPLAFHDGEARVPAPDALLGTLWVAAGDRTIDAVRAFNETVGVDGAATSIGALIDANIGRIATLLVDDREYTGKLLAAPEALVLLDVDGKVYAFNRGSVKHLTFATLPVLRVSTPTQRAALTIQARGADGAETATIRYLRSGLSWLPEYVVELLDDKRARVSMRATLVNDAEDLRNARVRFAVGYPNFAFAGVPSPLTLQQGLQEILSALARDPSGTRGRFDNSIASQMMVNVATAAGNDAMVFPVPPSTGESAEDLFFYEKDRLTVAKGQRVQLPILEQVVPLRHIYRWNAADGQVWHSISLTNNGSTPWTTASALVMANGKPLAQDMLAYTASGAPGEVKLTIATDVAVEHEEAEVERKPRATERSGYSYASVVVEGTLTIRNYKREAITVEVTKTIEGESTLREPAAEVTRLALQPNAINPSERLAWQVPVGAGGTAKVRYRYKVWVRE
ncbi:MAG TPA: hypothetical protein VGD79_13500 [Thermoanaerobaculia bacterium]